VKAGHGRFPGQLGGEISERGIKRHGLRQGAIGP